MENNIHPLEKVCADYCMSGFEVYEVLLSKEDTDFPLSFESIRDMVLKSITAEVLEGIFTFEELKRIFSHVNVKKIKNEQTRKWLKALNPNPKA